MKYDRTGAMLRDLYNGCCCAAGGIFCLVSLGGFWWITHEVLIPSGREVPVFVEMLRDTLDGTIEGGRGSVEVL